jgi:hypothetical protein
MNVEVSVIERGSDECRGIFIRVCIDCCYGIKGMFLDSKQAGLSRMIAFFFLFFSRFHNFLEYNNDGLQMRV